MESFEIESGKPIVPTPVSDISSDYLELVEKKISTVDAMKELGKRAIPSIFGLMLKHIVDLLNITFAGRLEDPEAIDGVGLGLLSYNCLVFSVAWGMTGAIDTFVSQAYGQKKYYLCGTILNKGKIIMAILSAHQCILMLFIGDIFIILNQPKNPSRICQEFIRYQIIGLVCVNQFECIRRFLTAQGVYNIIKRRL